MNRRNQHVRRRLKQQQQSRDGIQQHGELHGIQYNTGSRSELESSNCESYDVMNRCACLTRPPKRTLEKFRATAGTCQSKHRHHYSSICKTAPGLQSTAMNVLSSANAGTGASRDAHILTRSSARLTLVDDPRRAYATSQMRAYLQYPLRFGLTGMFHYDACCCLTEFGYVRIKFFPVPKRARATGSAAMRS